jgi:Ca2+-transporting ATPase
MEDGDLVKAAFETGVFARVSPAHKLRILDALRARGEIVAMTGDGVNDAPALKGADIGVAMGITGTEVAKGAADMVLLDDNFATIVHAVEEGRGIFNNLRRVIFFLLATNLGEVLTLAASLALGLPLPLTAIMILWINLVTDGACTIPLGVEPRHLDVLESPPRNPRDPVLTTGLLVRLGILASVMTAGTILFFMYELKVTSLVQARTAAFTALAAFQWFQAFNARSSRRSVFSVGFFSNRWVLIGIGGAVLLQVLAVQTQAGNLVFGTVPLGLSDWLLIVLVSSSIWAADELLKLIGLYERFDRKKK